MKNKFRFRNVLLSLVAIAFIATQFGCSDDPQSVNEEEVITTITVTLTPQAEDDEEEEGLPPVVTLQWDDTNLDAIVDESEIVVSSALNINTTYKAEIVLFNKSANISVSDEVREEAEDHIFCFTVTGAKITVSNRDTDKNGLPLGLTSIWKTTTASEGTVNIMLRHQPDVKTGDCPGAGESDVNITFNVQVLSPN